MRLSNHYHPTPFFSSFFSLKTRKGRKINSTFKKWMIQQKVVCFRNRRKKNFGKQLVKNNYLSLEKKLERLIVE